MTKEEACRKACVRWYWIRHARVKQRDGIFTGSSDANANLQAARTEIPTLVKSLPQSTDLWVSSRLKRARQTMRVLRDIHQTERASCVSAQHCNKPAVCEQAFNEQNFGDWEGEPYDAVRHRALWDAPATHRPPNGESFADLVVRVACAVERIEHRLCCKRKSRDNPQRDNPQQTNPQQTNVQEETIAVVAVAHAGTIRAALAQALQLPPQHALSFVVDPLSLTRIDRLERSGQDRKTKEKIAIVRCVNLQQSQAEAEQGKTEEAR